MPNPTPVGAPRLDAVPTSDKLLVSLLTGFPFVPGNSSAGTSQQFMFNLTSATGELFILELRGQILRLKIDN